MIIFDDIAGKRFLARLDPRVRLGCVLLFAVLICLCEQTFTIVAGLLSGALLLAISGVPFKRAFRRLAGLNSFMLLLIVTMPLLLPGKPILHLGPITWGAEGLSRALLIAGRANAVMLMLTALLGSMEAAHLGFALKGLGISSKFTLLLLFMVRYIEVIHHEYHHLRDAMLLRAFRPRFNRHTFRTFGFMIGQLLVRSVNRSDRILEAMKCRGFRGQFYILAPCTIEVADIAFSVAAVAGIACIGFMEWL